MAKHQLHEHLAELHTELEKTKTLDDPSKKLLRRLAGDIQRLLDQDEKPSADEQESIADSLGEAARGFEVSHPTLAALIRNLGEALQQSGI